MIDGGRWSLDPGARKSRVFNINQIIRIDVLRC